MLYGLSFWIALTLVVLGLFAYRYSLSRREDDTVHLADSEVSLIGEQSALAARINTIDRWRNRLTAVDIVVGVTLFSIFAYDALKSSGII